MSDSDTDVAPQHSCAPNCEHDKEKHIYTTKWQGDDIVITLYPAGTEHFQNHCDLCGCKNPKYGIQCIVIGGTCAFVCDVPEDDPVVFPCYERAWSLMEKYNSSKAQLNNIANPFIYLIG